MNLASHVVSVVSEPKSAKQPGNRPQFSQLLRDIRAKKIDGIIAWHPDRLSRNMVEAGRIIEMLDNGILKDLRFKTFQFSNDANGKMMLGMLFVFAKHYSDDLQAKVNRGNKGNLLEGKSNGAPKHGYIREDDGLYRPDKTFALVQEAWHLRTEGMTEEDVAQYMNDHSYAKYNKTRGEYVPRTMTKQLVSAMFSDTFYYGLLNQANQTIDLREVYAFEPMVDEATYYKIQGMSGRYTRRTEKNRYVWLPLRHIVFCAVCGDPRPMNVGRPGNTKTNYLRYWCKNKDCTREPVKGVRGKVIFDQLTAVINEHLTNLSDEAYAYYLVEAKQLSDGQKVKLRGEISAAKTILRGHEDKQKELTLALGRSKNDRVTASINSQLADLLLDIERQEALVKRHEVKLTKSALPPLTPDEFAERVRKMPAKFKAATGVQKDVIARNVFLNIRLGHEGVASYLWNEPFATLLKATDFKNGRGDRT